MISSENSNSIASFKHAMRNNGFGKVGVKTMEKYPMLEVFTDTLGVHSYVVGNGILNPILNISFTDPKIDYDQLEADIKTITAEYNSIFLE